MQEHLETFNEASFSRKICGMHPSMAVAVREFLRKDKQDLGPLIARTFKNNIKEVLGDEASVVIHTGGPRGSGTCLLDTSSLSAEDNALEEENANDNGKNERKYKKNATKGKIVSIDNSVQDEVEKKLLRRTYKLPLKTEQ